MPLFLFIFHILYIHTFIQSQIIHTSPFAKASLHFFIACMLSGEDLPVVPSRESNSGLPYSKPTRCQLSHAAPYSHHILLLEICGPILLGYLNRSQAHECGNWDWGRAIARIGIHKWDFRCRVWTEMGSNLSLELNMTRGSHWQTDSQKR
jgi:hypothetical protein